MSAQKKVLFLCTGNSARSQIAEALLRHIAGERFVVASAGTDPRAAIDPDALLTLARHKVPTEGLRPKHVSTFVGERFDFVITLCDRAGERCAVPPDAEALHWSFPDPAPQVGEARAHAFEQVFQGLSNRIRLLLIILER